jgi:hypothetical protein
MWAAIVRLQKSSAGDLALAGRFGSLAGRFGSGREIWLSPVIQATWEARTVEWLEVSR